MPLGLIHQKQIYTMYLGFLFGVALVQVAAAQVFSYIPRNGGANPALITANQQNAMAANAVASNAMTANAMTANAMTANAMTANAMSANAMAANAMAANSMAGNGNNVRVMSNNGVGHTRPIQNNVIANLPANDMTNVVGAALTNTNTIANTQTANTAIVNAINENAAIAANRQEFANAITNAELANIANTNFGAGANSHLAALASLANINGNTATFNFGNDGRGFTVTSGSPNSQGFGIQILADALDVGGTVAVNGQIPIFGAVALNGNLPTDGSAVVHYSCGRQAPVQAAPAALATLDAV